MSDTRGKPKNLRLVPVTIFIYDSARLFFIIALLALYAKTGPDFMGINLPLMMFAAPNALFPLMSFFIFLRPGLSKAFVPLYLIGKILCVLCLMIWLFFTFRQIYFAREILWALFLCAADLATVLGTALINEERALSIIETENTIAEAVEGGE